MTRLALIGAALLTVACGLAPESRLTLGRPVALAALTGLEAEAQVYDEATGCEVAEAREQVALEPQADGTFFGTLRLRPGSYFFCVVFTSGEHPVAAYRDLQLEVETDVDKTLELDDAKFSYREHDSDGDGIANLDELRYGFAIDSADADADLRAPVIDLVAPSNPFAAGLPAERGTVVESPVQLVELGSFDIDAHEVSVARYRLCVARDICQPPLPHSRASFLEDLETTTLALPAVGMRQSDAMRFCEQIAGGRLPTEFEWEYAARPAGDLYPWGDDPPPPDVSRCDWINARHYAGSVAEGTSFPCQANALGLPGLRAVDHYSADLVGASRQGCARRRGSTQPDGPCQMAGNAWEWTASRFVPYSGALWESPAEELYVIRGGSADSLDHSLRATFRAGVAPDLASHEGLAPYVGFRCVYPD